MPSPLEWVWRSSLRRGLLGTSDRWTLVFAVLGMVRLIRWVARRTDAPIAVTERLKPGETLIITHER